MNQTEGTFRYATEADMALVMDFVRAIAAYEKMSDDVIATPELFHHAMFVEKRAEVIFCMENGKEVGFALFFHNFSTFLARTGMYLEDLFVFPEHRGKGYGKALLKKVAAIAVERNCRRMEWSCLDWNKPSIDFYLSMNAVPMDDWTTYRLAGDTLITAAQ